MSRPTTLASLLMVVLAAQPAASGAQERGLTDKARTVLTRMADFVSSAQSFSLSAEMGNEVLQSDGQRLEDGSRISAVFRRPAEGNVRFDNRDGYKATIVLDGESLSFVSSREAQHIYDTTVQPGDIDASFVFLARQIGVPDQLNHFFAIDLTDRLMRQARSGYVVGTANIRGVLCDNLALRSDDEDVQIWIERGALPVPRRIVVTYKNRPGQPQFWANFDRWDFSPDLAESTFSFSPPPDATRIEFFRDISDDRQD